MTWERNALKETVEALSKQAIRHAGERAEYIRAAAPVKLLIYAMMADAQFANNGESVVVKLDRATYDDLLRFEHTIPDPEIPLI